MRFQKDDNWTKAAARKGGKAAAAKRWGEKWQAEQRAAMAQERAAFEEFANAESGIFNGFEMLNVFHLSISKDRALIVDMSDDGGDCRGVHVGADGVWVYFFTQPEHARKQVRFNRSVYVF